MEGFRKGVLGLAIAVCALTASACGSAKPVGHPGARPVSEKIRWVADRPGPLVTHRVVLSRSWTPAILTQITDRIDPRRGVSVKPVYLRHVPPGSPKGWWFRWNDPTRNSQAQGMLDYWTAQIVGRLYQARRVQSAPKLSGIQLQTQVPSTDTDWSAGENSHWWTGAPSYLETRPAALRSRIQERAASLGLRIRSLRIPRLDGILAPVITLQVSDEARFKRWYAPGCAEGWIVGPRADTNGSPYFGFFLTVDDASGNWLGSVAASPQGGDSEESSEMHKLFPPHVANGQVGGLATCPARFGRG
jgi:hypothetical protein